MLCILYYFLRIIIISQLSSRHYNRVQHFFLIYIFLFLFTLNVCLQICIPVIRWITFVFMKWETLLELMRNDCERTIPRHSHICVKKHSVKYLTCVHISFTNVFIIYLIICIVNYPKPLLVYALCICCYEVRRLCKTITTLIELKYWNLFISNT